MVDYLRELGKSLTEDDLIEVLGDVALLNKQPFCENWVELISSVGVEGMLNLCKYLGGKQFTVPNLYQVLMVYSALIVLQAEKKGYSTEESKNMVIGGLYLEGFDELVEAIRRVKKCDPDAVQ